MTRILVLLFLLTSGLCYGQVNLNLGLRAYYPFSGNANDISGNNNNPVFNNATLTADRFGNPNSAYRFDGTSNYMRVVNNASINSSNTLSLVAWVKPQGFYAGTCHGNAVMMKGDADYLPGNYFLRFDDGPFSNFANCSSVMDPAHQNFYGNGAASPAPGYTPYIQTNQWYSVIVTYDGTTAKVYVNCVLKVSAPQAGATFTNLYDLYLGKLNNGSFPYWFNGDMDEVRIYDRPLTVDEVNVLGGCPTGGTTLNGIINTYTPVLALSPCDNKLTVEDASTFNVGDTVLMIQMKGAVIDSTNTSTFGTVTDYKNSGNYEFNYINSKAGNVLELKNKLVKQYDIPVGKVQLIRVPYYNDATILGTLTCSPWDGSKGGVLVLNAAGTVTLGADIDVSGKGFRGGKALNSGLLNYQPLCGTQTYYTPNTPTAKQEKGEGIAEVSIQKMSGRGPLANGGGGANLINTGGGGGSNGTVGGKGGDQYQECIMTPNNVGGLGGKALLYSAAQNKIFLGGGGGAGDANDSNVPIFNPDGRNGGGIVIIKSNAFQSNSFSIIANGDNGKACITNCKEGMGGGGAGGTVLLEINNYSAGTHNVISKGGKGTDNVPHNGIFNHGPGGGGSGGVLFISNASLPAVMAPNLSGGLNGLSLNSPTLAWGAQPGNTGQTVFNLQIPFSSVLFKPNIDSVRIKDSALNCNGFDFKGLGYTNTNPIVTWQWYFGDGNTANTQNTSHAYGAAGLYNVKLVLTDINGCKDSTMKDVTALQGIVADAGIDTAFCSNGPITVVLHGSGAGTYAWSPAGLLNDATLQNPTATISATTKFYLTVTGASACSSLDSVTISVNSVPTVQTLPDTSICRNDVLLLTTTAGLASYSWSPAIHVSNPAIANPLFIDVQPRTLYVTGTNSFGCFAIDTINVDVKPLPVVSSINDTIICNTNTITLTTTGAQTYSWSPTIFLSNPNIASPDFTGSSSQTYYVTGTGANGCKAKDTVSVTVNTAVAFQAPPDKTMCNQSSVVLDGYNGTSVNYLWSPGTYLSSTTIINPVASPPSTMTYSVLITDPACKVSGNFTVRVIVGAKPFVNAGKSNDIDCANRSASLFASGGTRYLWTPSTGLSNDTIANPVATPKITQKYIVLVTDAGGCSNTDSITVFNNKTASLARYMPNAFTPNGDGKNDCYGLKNWMLIKKLQFFIFNVYGEQVFATANPSNCWDGTFKGKPALAGTYVFYIKAETECGTEEQKGNLILIR